jgi:hypothetical protein
MRRALWAAWPVIAAALAGGCASGPVMDNPALIRPDPNVTLDNPVFIAQGPPAYGKVFEKVFDVVSDYFEIAEANRYDGRIETFPRIAPGLEQPWKPGSPDFYQRLLASLQTIRYRASVQIQPADNGGFFVSVAVYKELEDLPRPVRQTQGAAAFRTEPTVERQFEVIDPTVLEANWIPVGRETALEQVILQRIENCPISP